MEVDMLQCRFIFLYLCIIMKKIPHVGLLGRIVIAIASGIAAGFVFPEWLDRIFVTFNSIFGQFLTFLIPLIILGFVAPAIADIGAKAGKMLVFTALLAYGATLMAGFISYFTGAAVFPHLIGQGVSMAPTGDVASMAPYFTVEIPVFMSVMTSLVFAFMIGLGVAVSAGRTLHNVLEEFRAVVQLTIVKIIIPLLPLYIFGIFLSITVEGTVVVILTSFAKIIGVIFVLHIGILLLQYSIAALFNRRNPLRMLWSMMPAYFTALGTQSSAATIPVTLRETIKMGVSKDVAGFVVPLCATIHMSGSTLKIVACALAIMIMEGEPYSAGQFANFIAMLGVTIIAAPGIPGGAIMASLGLLSSILGFTEAQNAMMIALYIAMDSFGTACNVTGDGALSVIVDYFFGKKTSRLCNFQDSCASNEIKNPDNLK